MLGVDRLKEPYPESPKVADEAGDGVKMGGEETEDCEPTGDCSKGMGQKTLYWTTRLAIVPDARPAYFDHSRSASGSDERAGIQVDGGQVEELERDH